MRCNPRAVRHIPRGVRALDFSRQSFDISRLRGEGLTWFYLLHLNLTRCGVKNMTVFLGEDANHVFMSLRVLDLRFNRIRHVPDITLPRLLELYLDKNPIIQVDIKIELTHLILPRGKFGDTLGWNNHTFLKMVYNLDVSQNDIQELILANASTLKTPPYFSFMIKANLSHNKFSDLTYFFKLCRDMEMIDVSYNRITDLSFHTFNGMRKLRRVYMRSNRIGDLKNTDFAACDYLEELDLGQNKICNIQNKTLFPLIDLRKIWLDSNCLKTLDPATFSKVKYVNVLNLSNNQLKKVDVRTFSDLNYLQIINVSHNFMAFPGGGIFVNQSMLYMLDLRGNNLNLTFDMYRGIGTMDILYVDSFSYCCPLNSKDVCKAPEEIFSSCSNLIDNGFLSVCIWFTSVFSVVGNTIALAFRSRQRNILKHTYDILVTQLSLSDFITGLYLLIIGIYDLMSRGGYGYEDAYWRNSTTCTIAGAMATFSAVASTFFILGITFDRLIVLRYPHTSPGFRRKGIVLFSIFTWIFSAMCGAIPTFETLRYYFPKNFYSRSSVCISMPLTKLTLFLQGWEYTVGIFVALSTVVYLAVCIGQILIFAEIRSSGIKGMDVKKEREIAVAKTLSTVVVSDTLCWVPISIFW